MVCPYVLTWKDVKYTKLIEKTVLDDSVYDKVLFCKIKLLKNTCIYEERVREI